MGGYASYDFESKLKGTTIRKIGIFKKPEDKVELGENILENVRKFFIVDKEFLKGGMTGIIDHEKQHLFGPAGKLYKRKNKETEKIAGQKTNDMEVIIEEMREVYDKYYPYEEKQAELQKINKHYENMNDFIETEARHLITLSVIYWGFDYLENIRFDPSSTTLTIVYNLIKEKVNRKIGKNSEEIELHKKIIERMEEMRKDLVKKYEKHKGEF